MSTIDTRRMMTFTGINFRPDQDLTRRVIVIELDTPADMTLTQERKFTNADRSNKQELLTWVRKNRHDLLAAALTLFNNWKVKGLPKCEFEWDFPIYIHTVGGIMQAAGVTSWMGNRHTVISNADEARQGAFVMRLAALIDAEKAQAGSEIAEKGGRFRARQLASLMLAHENDANNYGKLLVDDITWEDVWAARLSTDIARRKIDVLTRTMGNWLSSLKGRTLTDHATGRVRIDGVPGGGGKDWWSFTTKVNVDSDESMPEPPEKRHPGRPPSKRPAPPARKRLIPRR